MSGNIYENCSHIKTFIHKTLKIILIGVTDIKKFQTLRVNSAPELKFNMFCVLSQNDQHFLWGGDMITLKQI